VGVTARRFAAVVYLLLQQQLLLLLIRNILSPSQYTQEDGFVVDEDIDEGEGEGEEGGRRLKKKKKKRRSRALEMDEDDYELLEEKGIRVRRLTWAAYVAVLGAGHAACKRCVGHVAVLGAGHAACKRCVGHVAVLAAGLVCYQCMWGGCRHRFGWLMWSLARCNAWGSAPRVA
jgi:hypothetical protein